MWSLSASMIAVALLGGCSSSSRGPQGGERAARPPLGAPIDRIGRALTANALLGPIAPDEVGDRMKEAYNRAAPPAWPEFAAEMQRTLGLYDGFDGQCGNQWLADRSGGGGDARYAALAKTLADDRLWVDSAATVCAQYFAVELGALAQPAAATTDCGGRTPDHDAPDVFRSLLVRGAITGVDDGVARDDGTHSLGEFPFLGPPR